jgi:hypothetical protein
MDDKRLIAVNRTQYRGIDILEMESGYCLIMNGRRYDFETLTEATACVDAIYAAFSNILTSVALAE